MIESPTAAAAAGSFSSLVPRSVGDLPLGTKAILALIVVVDVAVALVPRSVLPYPCFGAGTATFASFVLGPLVHANLLHFLFNALAFATSGAVLENFLGTMPFLGLNAVLLLATQAVFWLVQSFLSFALGGTALSPAHTCVVGYSGVIFAILAFECYSSIAQSHYSVCGLFTVPARAFPFALVAFCWVLMPHASFLGHLVGVLAGICAIRYLPREMYAFFAACAPFRWRDLQTFRHPAWELLLPSHHHAGHHAVPVMLSGRTGDDFPGLPSVSSVGGLSVGEKPFVPFAGSGRTLGGGGGGGGNGSGVTGSNNAAIGATSRSVEDVV